ncbi:hypothetical protein HDU93_009987 [Gonapodya sp. JEL0774]|nr:hypothetical protein HDU93_009987 [Gonapodya sp. JEL0774]
MLTSNPTSGNSTQSPTPVLVFGSFFKSYSALIPRTPEITWVPVDNDSSLPLDPNQNELAAQSQILLGPFNVKGRDTSVDVKRTLEKWKRVSLVIAPSAGTEHFTFPGIQGLVRITISQVNSSAIAEFVLAAILRQAKRFHERSLPATDDSWWTRGTALASGDIEGSRIFILGLGSIGLEIAKRAKAFGMEVFGSKRSVQGVPPANVDNVYAADEWASNTDLLSTIDYLVIAAPASASTENIVNRDVFSKLKKGAYVVNISRGALLDESALIESVESGQISGASS